MIIPPTSSLPPSVGAGARVPSAANSAYSSTWTLCESLERRGLWTLSACALASAAFLRVRTRFWVLTAVQLVIKELGKTADPIYAALGADHWLQEAGVGSPNDQLSDLQAIRLLGSRPETIDCRCAIDNMSVD